MSTWVVRLYGANSKLVVVDGRQALIGACQDMQSVLGKRLKCKTKGPPLRVTPCTSLLLVLVPGLELRLVGCTL